MSELKKGDELIRVTAVPFRRTSATVVRGVPVGDDHSLASATYYVSVVAQTAYLPVDPIPGQLWRVSGSKTISVMDHGAYKTHEHAYREPEVFELKMPETGESFIRFVGSDRAFTGIGEVKARQLWSRFGDEIHRMLTQGTADDINALSGLLSDRSIKALYAGYEKYKNLRYTVWMSQARIPQAVQRRILKHYNLGSVKAIKANPFELINYGLSFKEIDQILNHRFGHAWGEERYPKERIQAAMIQSIKDCMSDGSTWLKPGQVKSRAVGYLKSEQKSAEGIEWLKNTPSVALYHPEGRLHRTATAIQELAVAKRIKHLLSLREPLAESEEIVVEEVISDLPYDLTGQQRLAIYTSLTEGVSCITGGAGTGKTTVLATFLKAAERLGYNIHAVALSGRAAMRLHESVGYPTMTIARFLREDIIMDTKALLVIDEASMTDLPTMYRIISHMAPSVKLVLTGDPSQLPPIGVGKILHDLVLSDRVQNTMLDIVKRQKGSTGIPEYSKTVNAGEIPALLSTGGIHFHDIADPDLGLEKAIELYLERPDESRVIAPTRKLVDAANCAIQDRFNNGSPPLNFTLDGEDYFLELRLNDQILFTQNHPAAGVQNGSLGRLISVGQDGDVIGLVRLDTGETVEIEGALIDALGLGYALTLHKAQGSQFPRVIVILKEGRVVDRSWVYTAITRAETEVHIIGSSAAFQRVVETVPKAFRRKTLLTNLIAFLDD